ncbi:hypothetical protein ACIBCN_17220 [Nocardia sp. NPDC051052]|uniref:hypothetical protein n=1 Tax=Nocardia sp. NPDC051052 TaxID=3364322 RepID=UPI0037B8A157
MVMNSQLISNLRMWIDEELGQLQAAGAECGWGENADSAGNDPVFWIHIDHGSRGGKVSLWRSNDVELILVDADGDEDPSYTHFSPQDVSELERIINRLVAWVGAEGTG